MYYNKQQNNPETLLMGLLIGATTVMLFGMVLLQHFR